MEGKYLKAVYAVDAAETGNYHHYCPKCGRSTDAAKFVKEVGYYDRTCYSICKCGSGIVECG